MILVNISHALRGLDKNSYMAQYLTACAIEEHQETESIGNISECIRVLNLSHEDLNRIAVEFWSLAPGKTINL